MGGKRARTAKAPPDRQRRRLLTLLADGAFYSGERLAAELRVTRSAVWKLIGKLRALGTPIEAIPRQGYRLQHAVELYDEAVIRAALGDAVRESVQSIDVLLTVDSTNRYLLDATAPDTGIAKVCVAEIQTAGRGRRGRTWLAPFASGICLSTSWQFAESPPTFSALSLAVGLAVVRALKRYGEHDVRLKWPNDLVWQQRKLAGILIDLVGEASGPARVVIGIGLNLQLPAATRLSLAEQQAALVTDLHEVYGSKTPGRNAVVAAILEELVLMLRQFEIEGFAAFADEWSACDALKDAPVRVLAANDTLNGIARGVAGDGALQVEISGQLRRFMSGEVSLRAVGR